MAKTFLSLVLAILFCGCGQGPKVDDNSSQSTPQQENWLTFDYKEIKGYVTRTPWTNELIIKNDSLTHLVSDRFTITLDKTQEKQFLELLTQANTEGDTTQADCFYPRHGFVFWDSVGRPAAHISICFECGRFQALPALDRLSLYELELFCQEIGLPVFENPIEHKKYFDSLENKQNAFVKNDSE